MKMKGHIFQISASEGGVPKLGLHRAEVTELGLAGDRHHDLEHHGGPERALCLFSLERILALQGEGHPVFPGALGENLTLVGLDWSQVLPGARLRLGEAVSIEVTRYTSPCSNLVASFQDGDFSRVSQKANPGWSRLYARVMVGGLIGIGDPVELVQA